MLLHTQSLLDRVYTFYKELEWAAPEHKDARECSLWAQSRGFRGITLNSWTCLSEANMLITLLIWLLPILCKLVWLLVDGGSSRLCFTLEHHPLCSQSKAHPT